MGDQCQCAGLKAQIDFLAGELSRARIRPDHDRCCRCTEYGYEACKACWIRGAEVEAFKQALTAAMEKLYG